MSAPSTPKAAERLAALAVRQGVSLGALQSTSARDFSLVLAAAAQRFTAGRNYSEPEVNELLRAFLDGAGGMLATDHVELRRWLVDCRVLERDGYGRAYALGDHPREDIAAAASELAGVDLDALTRAAREADVVRRAERKARWQAGRTGKS